MNNLNVILENLPETWLWKDKPFAKGQAWTDLLLMATQERIIFRNKSYNLPQGQLITSETELRKQWGWSRTKVRSFLLLLSEESMIEIESQRSKTLITIVYIKLQTAKGQIQEQEKVQKKEQVEIQPKPSDNECKEEICKQEKKQVEIQNEDKEENKIETKKRPQQIQLTIYDAIEKNNHERNQPTQ